MSKYDQSNFLFSGSSCKSQQKSVVFAYVVYFLKKILVEIAERAKILQKQENEPEPIVFIMNCWLSI